MIAKITKKKLSDFRGILSKESAEEMEININRNRKESNQRRKLRIKRIQESFC